MCDERVWDERLCGMRGCVGREGVWDDRVWDDRVCGMRGCVG